MDGVAGVQFAVWAPNAERVSVIGDFNGWDTDANPMQVHPEAGVWECFIPGVRAGALYKYQIFSRYDDYQASKGRSVRLRGRDPAPNGVEGVGPFRLRMGRSGMDGEARRRNRHRGADLHLRSPPRFLGARSRGGQPLAHLPGNGRPAGRVCARHGFHPRGVYAGVGASLRRVLGLPDRRLLRTHQPVRHAAGFHVPGGYPPPARHRRHPRLGARALPHRRPRAGLLRRHAPLRTRRSAPGPASGLGHVRVQLRPQRGAQFSHQQRAVLVRPLPHRRPARGRRGFDALPGLRAARGRVDPQPLRRQGEPGGHRLSADAERR